MDLNDWQNAAKLAAGKSNVSHYGLVISRLMNLLEFEKAFDLFTIVSNDVGNCEIGKQEIVTQLSNLVNRNNLKAILTMVNSLYSKELDKGIPFDKIASKLKSKDEIDVVITFADDQIQSLWCKISILNELHLTLIKIEIEVEDFQIPWKSLDLLSESARYEGHELVIEKWMARGEIDKIFAIIEKLLASLIDLVIDRLLACGNWEKAMAFGNAVSCDNQKGHIFGTIAIDFLTKEKTDEALKMATTPKPDLAKVGALQKLGTYCLEVGDVAQFLSIISKIDQFQIKLEARYDEYLKQSATMLQQKFRKYEEALNLIALMSPEFKTSEQMQKWTAQIKLQLVSRNKRNATK